MAVQKDTVDPIISIKNGVYRYGKRHFLKLYNPKWI